MQMRDLIDERIEQAKKEELVIRILVLTFLGGVFHAVLIFVFYWPEIARAPTATVGPFTIPWNVNILYLGSAFLYSLLASVLFKEKRIISPFVVQIVAAGISFSAVITAFFVLIQTSFAPLPTIIAQLGFIFYLFAIYGFFINRVLRKLTGYSGSRENLEEDAIVIHGCSYEDARKILSTSAFLYTNSLEKAKLKDKKKNDEDEESNNEEEKPVTILKSDKRQNPQVTILLTFHAEKNNVVIAFASYEMQYNSIIKSPNAIQELKNKKGAVFEAIKSMFSESHEILAGKPDADKTRAANLAAWEALKITHSSYQRLEKPQYTLIALIGISIAIGGLATYFIYQNQLPELAKGNPFDYNSIISIWTTIMVIVAAGITSVVLEKRTTSTKPREAKPKEN